MRLPPRRNSTQVSAVFRVLPIFLMPLPTIPLGARADTFSFGITNPMAYMPALVAEEHDFWRDEGININVA